MMADDMAEAVPLTLLEEDRAVSALGGQSAFMSMLNMASNFEMDLHDIDDEDEEDSGEETEGPSSRASSIRLKRMSSADSFRATPGGESDGNESDFDLSELKKARLQHPGTISMFGSFSDTAIKDDFEGGPEAANAKLRKLFDLPEDEHIVTEFPAWLVKNVMIQGYMLVTERHICFFAALPRTDNTLVKTGYLFKKARNTPRRHRKWFVLKNDVLSYFDDPSDLYFPSGTVNLRYALDAEMDIRDSKEKDFKLITVNRVYHLRADSTSSAKMWVKQLQRVIFKSRNQGNNVKISIPIANVLEVEEMHLLGSSDTLKMTVLDNDETYAMDEFYFSFFSRTREAFTRLQAALDAKRKEEKEEEGPQSPEPGAPTPRLSRESTKFLDSVQDTTMHIRSSSPTQEHFDLPRRSTDNSRRHELTDEPEILAPTPKRHSFRMSRDTIRQFSLGSLNRKSSRSRSPLRHSFESVERASSGHTTPHAHEPTWTDTGKMLWFKGVDVADWLQQRSSKVSSQVGTMLASPVGTTIQSGVGKVSQLWNGDYSQTQHAKWVYEETAKDMKDQNPEERFQTHFSLPQTEKLLGAYYGYVFRTFPFYGKIYLSKRHLCFRSLLPGIKTKMVLPIRDVETARKEKAYHWSNFGLVVVIRGHEELFFEFGQEGVRNECVQLLTERIEDTDTESIHQDVPSDSILGVPWVGNNIVFKTTKPVDNTHPDCYDGLEGDLQSLAEKAEDDTPALMFDSSAVSMVSFKPSESLRFTCLTIGSRGDVQPYIALCKGLQRDGHTVKIASHEEYRGWVEGHGIQFAAVEGDPAELMRLCIEHGIFTVSFLKEAHGNFRKWLDGLLLTAWEACQDSDVLIESPSTMAGIHIAEALKIPYFRAFTMPWTRTRTYPHAFAVPDLKMGGGYNYMTYTVFDNLFWRATAGQINRWRKKKLGLKSTNLDKLQVNKVPFLYNFSPSVVPPPLDWVDWIIVTGYWFLDDADSSSTKQWNPPEDVVRFIAKAREDRKKIVYIGFGSIVVSDSRALTQTVIDSVMKAGVRCILAKGWSDRMDDKNVQKPEVPLPDDILSVKSVPHDWLFPQIDAAIHHGGAGTTGASLRAGLVTVIKPYFGDQYFWGIRVEDLGVGLCIRKLNVPTFTKALIEATRNEKMIHKAKALGEMIRKENGVSTAIQAIYRDMEYAKTLIKLRDSPKLDVLSDESWTMVDDENLPMDDHPSRYVEKSQEGRLSRLSKKFNLPAATTALNPTAWNRALKQRNEQLRNEAEGKPSEFDVAEVKTVHGGD